MRTKLLVGLLLAGSSLFAETHVSIGIAVGGYGNGYYAPPPRAVVAYAPPCPGPGYAWVDGYWYQVGYRRFWHAGYWAPPVYSRPYRVDPRYEGYYENRYYSERLDDRDRCYRDGRRRYDRDDDRDDRDRYRNRYERR
jgi:hypothetical protein